MQWQIISWRTPIIGVPFRAGIKSHLGVTSVTTARDYNNIRNRVRQNERDIEVVIRGSFGPTRYTVIKRRHVGHIHRCLAAAAVTGSSWICARNTKFFPIDFSLVNRSPTKPAAFDSLRSPLDSLDGRCLNAASSMNKLRRWRDEYTSGIFFPSRPVVLRCRSFRARFLRDQRLGRLRLAWFCVPRRTIVLSLMNDPRWLQVIMLAKDSPIVRVTFPRTNISCRSGWITIASAEVDRSTEIVISHVNPLIN